MLHERIALLSATLFSISIAVMTCCAQDAVRPAPGTEPQGATLADQAAGTSNGCSQAVLTVLGDKESGRNYLLRLNTARGLGKSVSADDVSGLCRFLDRKDGEDPLAPPELNAVKNEVVNALKGHAKRVKELPGALIRMYRDQEHDPVWRDYCIQQMGTCYRQADEREKAAIAEALWQATGEAKSTLAGTALLALAANMDEPGIDRKKLSDSALSLLEGTDTGASARISTLQVGGKVGDSRFLPVARRLATSESNLVVRVSAIAALGALGEAEDHAYLESLAKSGDVRLGKAAAAALRRMNGSAQ